MFFSLKLVRRSPMTSIVERLHRHMLAWAKSTGFLPERLEGVLPREFIWWPNNLELVRHALQLLELKSDDVLLDIARATVQF